MRTWTIPFGRLFGVDVRIHLFFVALPVLCMSVAYSLHLNAARGFGLSFFVLLAVAVREIARGITGAWVSLTPHSLVLLPTGGISTYAATDADDEEHAYPVLAPQDPAETPETPATLEASAAVAQQAKQRAAYRAVALAGPLANLLFGLMLAGIVLTFAPEVNLLQTPWISPARLLRAMVWINLLMAAIHLLPAWPLDGVYLFGKLAGRAAPVRTATGVGPVVAVMMIAAGVLLANMWLVIVGVIVLIAAQFDQAGGSVVEPRADTVLMQDVMMQDYTVISASATLEDALRHCTHTLQDVFPVVRGGNLVGAVSRQNILEALQSGGNSYVQGIMTRSFQTARPGDALVKTLRRLMAGQLGASAQLVPVVDGEAGERIVGIITPQNLQRSMSLLDHSRRMLAERELQKEQDKP